MKIDWIEWVGRGMQLALVVLVVGGLYGWAQQQSAKQEALCDAAQSYWEELDGGAEAKRLEKVLWNSCWGEPDYVE